MNVGWLKCSAHPKLQQQLFDSNGKLFCGKIKCQTNNQPFKGTTKSLLILILCNHSQCYPFQDMSRWEKSNTLKLLGSGGNRGEQSFRVGHNTEGPCVHLSHRHNPYCEHSALRQPSLFEHHWPFSHLNGYLHSHHTHLKELQPLWKSSTQNSSVPLKRKDFLFTLIMNPP